MVGRVTLKSLLDSNEKKCLPRVEVRNNFVLAYIHPCATPVPSIPEHVKGIKFAVPDDPFAHRTPPPVNALTVVLLC